MRSWRAKSAASSNAPAGVSPPLSQSAAECPPTAQNRGGGEPPQVESAEAAHRDPADRDSPWVRAGARKRRRDRLAQDVRAPRPVAAVVPVAVVAAIREQDVRRAGPLRAERLEERVAQGGARRGAAPVQPDEQRPPSTAAGRRDQDLAQGPVEEAAAQLETDDLCSFGAVVTPNRIANRHPGNRPRDGDDREPQPPSHA